MTSYLSQGRNGLRNQTVFLLSVRAGLRAKEIAELRWSMVLDADGRVSDAIRLTDAASKGRSGRVVPLNKTLRASLIELLREALAAPNFDASDAHVITTARSARTSPQVIVNAFHRWYRQLGLLGCSSHSGRRTFITNAARRISTVGGSIRDVQMLAGHASLQTTQRYIEADALAQARVVDLI